MVRKKLHLTLSQAIEGFMLQKRGQRLSKHTLGDYANTYRRFKAHIGEETMLNDIEPEDVSNFLSFLGTVPQPNRSVIPVEPKPLSNKSLLNAHTALSSLWTWAVKAGARMKAEGVRAGVPDLCLPVARGDYHGLYIELKVAGGRVRASQQRWLDYLEAQGYRAIVCWGWDEAKEEIERYLQQEVT